MNDVGTITPETPIFLNLIFAFNTCYVYISQFLNDDGFVFLSPCTKVNKDLNNNNDHTRFFDGDCRFCRSFGELFTKASIRERV